MRRLFNQRLLAADRVFNLVVLTHDAKQFGRDFKKAVTRFL
jgi:hypothetical protein